MEILLPSHKHHLPFHRCFIDSLICIKLTLHRTLPFYCCCALQQLPRPLKSMLRMSIAWKLFPGSCNFCWDFIPSLILFSPPVLFWILRNNIIQIQLCYFSWSETKVLIFKGDLKMFLWSKSVFGLHNGRSVSAELSFVHLNSY